MPNSVRYQYQTLSTIGWNLRNLGPIDLTFSFCTKQWKTKGYCDKVSLIFTRSMHPFHPDSFIYICSNFVYYPRSIEKRLQILNTALNYWSSSWIFEDVLIANVQTVFAQLTGCTADTVFYLLVFCHFTTDLVANLLHLVNWVVTTDILCYHVICCCYIFMSWPFDRSVWPFNWPFSLSVLAEPLRDLIKTNSPYIWGPEHTIPMHAIQRWYEHPS